MEQTTNAARKPKVYLSKVILNNGGYTKKGHYFGTGPQLWYYHCFESEEVGGYLRATNREIAKQEILKRYPEATFFA